jgi:hypothetical protein
LRGAIRLLCDAPPEVNNWKLLPGCHYDLKTSVIAAQETDAPDRDRLTAARKLCGVMLLSSQYCSVVSRCSDRFHPPETVSW